MGEMKKPFGERGQATVEYILMLEAGKIRAQTNFHTAAAAEAVK